MIQASRRTKWNCEPIPSVDSDNRECEIDDFLFAKLTPDKIIQLRVYPFWSNMRQGLRPSQGSAFSLVEEWRFAPSCKCIQPLLGLACDPSILCMHVNAIGAAVQLGYPRFNEFHQRVFQATAINIGLQSPKRPEFPQARFSNSSRGFPFARSFVPAEDLASRPPSSPPLNFHRLPSRHLLNCE